MDYDLRTFKGDLVAGVRHGELDHRVELVLLLDGEHGVLEADGRLEIRVVLHGIQSPAIAVRLTCLVAPVARLKPRHKAARCTAARLQPRRRMSATPESGVRSRRSEGDSSVDDR